MCAARLLQSRKSLVDFVFGLHRFKPSGYEFRKVVLLRSFKNNEKYEHDSRV